MLGYIFFKLRLKTILCLVVALSICFYISQVVISLYFRPLPLPIIIWWTPFMAEIERHIDCYGGKYTCLLTKDRNYHKDVALKAYLFYGSQFDPSSLPAPKDKLWALFHEESPRNSALFLYNKTQSLFEISSTFSRHSDYPVTLQYLESIENLLETKYYVSVEEKNILMKEKGLAPILYIQSDCDTPIERDAYVKELMKYAKVDSYGACLRNKEFPEELSTLNPLDYYNPELLNFIAKYKFVIAFENAVCDDYITEKLWRPLMVGSVPIYFGSPKVEDWLPNENSAILVKNFKTPEILARSIEEINSNNQAYGTFLEHKRGIISNNLLKETLQQGTFGLNTDKDHPIPAFECFVCKVVHEGITKRKITTQSFYDCPKPSKGNSWEAHWELGKCQSRALSNYAKNGGRFAGDRC